MIEDERILRKKYADVSAERNWSITVNVVLLVCLVVTTVIIIGG